MYIFWTFVVEGQVIISCSQFLAFMSICLGGTGQFSCGAPSIVNMSTFVIKGIGFIFLTTVSMWLSPPLLLRC